MAFLLAVVPDTLARDVRQRSTALLIEHDATKQPTTQRC